MTVGVISADSLTDKHYQHSGFSDTITDSYSSPAAAPTGMAWDYLNVISADTTFLSPKHYKHSGFSSTVTDSYSAPAAAPIGVAWDGSNVISADYGTAKHYQHSGFSDTITDSYASPAAGPTGIAWDGSNVISADNDDVKHYKHSGFSDTITDSYVAPSTDPWGITWDGANVISVDDDDTKHYKHSGFSDTISDSYTSPNIDPTGITWSFPTLLPTGIASAEAFGVHQLNLTLEPTGIASAEALGTPQVNLMLKPTGIASAEAFGVHQLNLTLEPTGIASAEALGTPQVNLMLKPTGIASAELFGTPQLNLTIKPVGIASAEVFGAHQLNLTLKPTGISSAEAFGTPEVFTWGRNAGTRWGDGALWGDTTLWGDKPGWGTGKLWGTGVLWGQRPYPYPRGNHIRLEIRTASGTDYTSSAIDTAWRIESVLAQRISRAYFTFRATSASDIDDHDEVIVLDQSQTRLFAGFVESFEARPDGVEIEHAVVCVDYSWLLDHPNQLITKVYEDGTSDKDIIVEIMKKYCPEIGTDDVDEIETDLAREYYEDMTPRQIIDSLCKRTGAVWYVDYGGAGDYKASLHYFLPGAAASSGLTLADGIHLDPPPYPYGDLVKRREHGTATEVIVEGRPSYVEVTEKAIAIADEDLDDSDLATRKRIKLPYKLKPLDGEIRPQIWAYDGTDYLWQKVGYGGTQDGLGDIDSGEHQVLWYNDDKYLEFYAAPTLDGTNYGVKYSAAELRPTEGVATDATGEAKYGRVLRTRVHDETIHDTATAQLVADALLDRWKADQDTYTCVFWEHGARAGETIHLTNTDLGISDDFIIQRLSGRGIGGDLWEYDLELAKYIPDAVDTLRDLTADKAGRDELEKGVGKPPVIGQVMFNIPGTISATNDTAAIYICAVNNLQILSTQSYAVTGPVGSNMTFKAYRYFSDPDHKWYGLWYSIYAIDEEPYIEDGETIGVDGTLSTEAGRPWLREGDMIKLKVDSWGSTTAGADVTVSLKVRQ